MRLAFVLYKYFPYGGMQRDCLRVIEQCLERGHEVDVYTMSWQGARPVAVNMTLLPKCGFSNHAAYKYFAQQVQQCLQEKPVDLLIGFNKIPGLDIYFAADPCYRERARREKPFWYLFFSRRYRLLASFEKSIFSSAATTEIIYISEKEKRKFIEQYKTTKQRFHRVPPGIERQRFSLAEINEVRENSRQQLGISPEQPLILFVGSGFHIKGLDRAITAMAALPLAIKEQAVMLVVGQDKNRAYLKQVEKLGLNGRVLFLQARDDVPQLMRAADVLLHPARNETGGNVLLEAAISGLPVITTDSCGYAPYVTQGRMGYVLASPFQQRVLNQLLPQVLTDTDKLACLKRSKVFANQANIFSLAEKTVDVIEQIGAERQ